MTPCLPCTSPDGAIEVLLIGTGETMVLLDPALRAAVLGISHGVSADAMATGAACRTFNVLLSENRRRADRGLNAGDKR